MRTVAVADLGAVAAEDHRAAECGGAGAGAGDDEPVGEPFAELVVDPRADERLKPGLVAAAEEDASRAVQKVLGFLAVGVGAASDRELAHVLHA